MIEPPWPASIMGGIVARRVFQTPVRLTSSTVRHCSGLISHTRPQALIPAFATTTSRRPNRATPSATAASTSSSARTSARRARTSAPVSPASATVSARSSAVAAG